MIVSDQNQLISGTIGYGLITRDPLVSDPQTYLYTTGRPTSRAIQWYTGLLVCNHCVVSYAPITVISPLIWDDQVALGVPPYIQNQPSGHMGLGVSSHYPPGAPKLPAACVWGLWGAQQ